MSSISRTEAVRRFNRFYTQRIGALHQGLLESPFSLTEVRIMYELAHREQPTASEICRDLGLDAGYLSRILSNFRKRGLITRRPADRDARQSLLCLTNKGRKEFVVLDQRSDQEVSDILAKMPASEQRRLIAAMGTIEELLEGKSTNSEPYLLRLHQPGDIGWVIHRHGVLYATEYHWDETFEALVARVAAEFIEKFDPKCERCWIAERNGEIVGSVFLVKKTRSVARLRLLLVEPSARGLGIGSRLVEECVRFARLKGYRKITLWTDNCLSAARHIYEKTGFRLVAQQAHHSFGHDLLGETWEIILSNKKEYGVRE